MVKDEIKQNYTQNTTSHFEPSEFEDMEFQVFTYSELNEHAVNGSKNWDRYSFAHVKPFVDKTGDIQEIIDLKWSLSEDESASTVTKHMDSYVHGLYRSCKAGVRGDVLGRNMLAAMSLFHLSQALFASQSRVAPYPNYLARELSKFPLQNFPVESSELISLLTAVASEGSITAQQKLASVVEKYVTQNNLYTYDRWREDYDWLMKI